MFDPSSGLTYWPGRDFSGWAMAEFSGLGTGSIPGIFGTGFEKKFTLVLLQFFSKIFEKNIKGDQGDFFQFVKKLIKNHAPVSA